MWQMPYVVCKASDIYILALYLKKKKSLLIVAIKGSLWRFSPAKEKTNFSLLWVSVHAP